jgi:hypothetical protein
MARKCLLSSLPCPSPSNVFRIPGRFLTPLVLVAAAGKFDLDNIRQELNATSKKISKLRVMERTNEIKNRLAAKKLRCRRPRAPSTQRSQ